jgi:putative glutamine amidotransferase
VKKVGLLCDRSFEDDVGSHRVGNEYVTAIRDGAGALPLLIPVTERALPVAEILAAVDGILLPGAPSNVDPVHYGGPSPAGMLLDQSRDAASLGLIRAALQAEKPLLAICRGFQEVNVALGGSLHQQVHKLPGRLDHREPKDAALAEQYRPSHPVELAEGGLLARLTGRGRLMVNSLHHQGIDRLAFGLKVEAVAPDGQIEAVSRPEGRGFFLGVQWHPEWQWQDDPASRAIFSAFGRSLTE